MHKIILAIGMSFMFCFSEGQTILEKVKKEGILNNIIINKINIYMHKNYSVICSRGFFEEFYEYSIIQLSGYRDLFLDELLLFFKSKKLIKVITFQTESLIKSGTGFKTKEILGNLSYNIDTSHRNVQIILIHYDSYRVDTLKDKPYFKNIKIHNSDTINLDY